MKPFRPGPRDHQSVVVLGPEFEPDDARVSSRGRALNKDHDIHFIVGVDEFDAAACHDARRDRDQLPTRRSRVGSDSIADDDSVSDDGSVSDNRSVSDSGSVTVEAALVLPVLVFILVLCLAGIGCVVDQLRCVDAAREAARLVGRGDPSAGRAAAIQIAPEGATVIVVSSGDLVRVTVTAAPFIGLLPGVRVGATSVAALESKVGRSP